MLCTYGNYLCILPIDSYGKWKRVLVKVFLSLYICKLSLLFVLLEIELRPLFILANSQPLGCNHSPRGFSEPHFMLYLRREAKISMANLIFFKDIFWLS